MTASLSGGGIGPDITPKGKAKTVISEVPVGRVRVAAYRGLEARQQQAQQRHSRKDYDARYQAALTLQCFWRCLVAQERTRRRRDQRDAHKREQMDAHTGKPQPLPGTKPGHPGWYVEGVAPPVVCLKVRQRFQPTNHNHSTTDSCTLFHGRMVVC